VSDAEQLPVLAVVDELEELVTTARRVPLSASVMVNEDEVLELVDRIRLALPGELVQARHLAEDRDRMIATAEREAEQLLSRAEHEAERLVRDASERAASMVAAHELTRQARAHAEAAAAEAEGRAAMVRSEADSYAREVMAKLEEQLGRALATVRKGIEALPRPAAATSRRRARSSDR